MSTRRAARSDQQKHAQLHELAREELQQRLIDGQLERIAGVVAKRLKDYEHTFAVEGEYLATTLQRARELYTNFAIKPVKTHDGGYLDFCFIEQLAAPPALNTVLVDCKGVTGSDKVVVAMAPPFELRLSPDQTEEDSVQLIKSQ